MKTINFCGMEMNVIADLGGGFVLAAHRNGPAIATEHSLTTLAFCGHQPSFKRTEDDEDEYGEGELILDEMDLPIIDDEGLPFDVRYRALTEYVDWSWEIAKHHRSTGLRDANGRVIQVGDLIRRPVTGNKDVHGEWSIYRVKLRGTVPGLFYVRSQTSQVFPEDYTGCCLSDLYESKALLFYVNFDDLRPTEAIVVCDESGNDK